MICVKSVAVALAVACAFSGGTKAEECGPLQLISSVALIAQGTDTLVPVKINNLPQKMILNTDGGVTTIDQKTVDELKLDPINTKFRLLDNVGNVSAKYVAVDFQLNNLENKDIQFMVTPDPDAGKSNSSAGTLAADLMSHYDLELNFSNGKLNLFSQEHCDGHVIYWHPTAIAVLPISLEKPRPVTIQGRLRAINTHKVYIWIPVVLDGKQFNAVIDTSLERSTMSAATAKYVFGVTPDSSNAANSLPEKSGPRSLPFDHVFKALTFDTVAITNPNIVIVPDLIGSKDPNNTFNTDSHVHRQDEDLGSEINIGMDILRQLRLYIAFRERKLYISPAEIVADPTVASPSKQ